MTDMFLFVVEDVFAIQGRGTVLVPGIPTSITAKKSFKIGQPLMLVSPDGVRQQTPMKGFDYLRGSDDVIITISLPKNRIPLGTKVFAVLDEEREITKSPQS